MLFVATTGDIEREDPASLRGIGHQQVVAGKEWNDRKTLHGHRQIAADHHRESICLALKGKRGALQLLVVLELNLKEAHEFDRETSRAGNADARMFVGLKHLFDVALGDDVAHRRSPVARHDDAAIKGDGHNRGAVWGIDGAGAKCATAGHHVWCVHAEEIGERPDARLMERVRQPPEWIGAHWPPFWM